jgi:hypothetical protein
MADVAPAPTHLIVTLSAETQDARDFYCESRLICAGCGATNRQVACWVLPGLCSECAMHVKSVTVAAPREQARLFPAAPRMSA